MSAVQRLQTDLPKKTTTSQAANMSTEAVASGTPPGGQSMLASQRAKEQAQQESEQKIQRRMGPFFPLGYKDAVYQWVRRPTPCESAVYAY